MAVKIYDDSLKDESTLTSTPMSRGTLLRGAAGLGAGLLGASTGIGLPGIMQSETAVAAPTRDVTGNIEVWYPYSGTTLQAFLKLFPLFQKSYPHITVKPVYAANDLSSNQKLFAAVAAGAPPDVTWVDGPEVSGWGVRGIIQSIDQYMKKDNISLSDFWTPCAKEIQYNGKVWALPYTADPNFGFFWNTQLFSAAGIKNAPRTFDEMNKMAQELTVVRNGNIQQAGLLPWNVYGYANSMITWGWMFGGNFFNQATNKVTANDPPIVAALEWMVTYAKKYDITKFAAFIAPFGGTSSFQAGQTFALGKLAMQPMGPWEIPAIAQYSPGMKYGIGLLPKYKNVPNSSWVGGWCVGIPKGAKNPAAAWEFVKWICASDGGTTAAGNAVLDFPGYKKSSFFKNVPSNITEFYPILQATQHQRPVTPAEDYYMGQLTNEVSNALYGKKTARQALTDVSNNTQKYLDGILKKG
ncbi:MAG TPA: ABC transporter substrate-binding protein [Chloroflexota bacterium]|nr:ABC transporter substrate-binding protein [Chloroflexota bacterium]